MITFSTENVRVGIEYVVRAYAYDAVFGHCVVIHPLLFLFVSLLLFLSFHLLFLSFSAAVLKLSHPPLKALRPNRTS